MFKVTKKNNSQGISVCYFSGIIDENTDFSSVLQDSQKDMIIDCEEVTRINSVGVKGWVKYFSALQTGRYNVEFQKLSVCLVEQANNVKNFLCGYKATSLCVPYICEKKNETKAICFTVEQLKKTQFNPPEIKDEQTNDLFIFDDIPEQYFIFINRE